ncbi:MAG: PAS domain S-box protein [Terracidiphilus sp.]
MRTHAEANLLALIESTEDLWSSVDLDYRLVVFNKNFERHVQSCFGVQMAVGMSSADFLPAERAAVWPPLYTRALTQGPFRTEYTLFDGRIFEMAIHPIVVDGKPAGVSVYGRDITDRKRAEMLLRNSEERFRSTFEQAAIGIVHTSFDGHYLRCNPRFTEIVGYSQEELSRLGFHEIIVPEDRAESARTFERMARGDTEATSIENRYRRKNGSLVWTKLTISTQRDGLGRPLHFIVFVEDINERKAAEHCLADAAQALETSEARYRAAFQNCLDGLAIVRIADGVFLDVNQALIDATGYEQHEIIGRSSLDLDMWADPGDRERLIQILLRDSVCHGFEALFKLPSGHALWGLISSSIIQVDGQLCHLAQVRDISAAKAAEQRMAVAAAALRLSEERYRTVFQTSLDGITISRISDGLYIDVNKSFLDFMGYEREEVIGRTSTEVGIWVDANDRQRLLELVRRNSGFRDENMRYRKKNGEMLWCLSSSSVIQIEGEPCLLSVVRDLSEAKAAAEKIEDLAFFDPLTRLPNRRQLLDRLRQALAAGSPSSRKCALLLIDIDNFKSLNEVLGHHLGDQLLQEAARRISASIRQSDFAARLGEDEFVVMLEDLSETPDLAAEQAKIVGEKLLATLARPCLLDGRECLSTSSIGITVAGDRREEAGEVLQQADIAMDQAKAAGRNTLRFFSPALRAAASARAALEEDLRQAIRGKQFLLYYQPQVSRGQVVGVEALIRWKHPQRGILAPGGFIPLAEETGLILDLGNWVLDTACEQIALWASDEKTAHLVVAVNISALQFRQAEFVQQVLAALKRAGADPRNLKLELTESMLVDNIEEVIAKMASLRSHEIGFSLDDFGTGYSSLSYLKRLPLDQLKIDRSFIRDLPADASSGAIAETIISLGRTMDLSVIAEGVETEEQRVFLAHLGCHSFQGYLTSRPLPVQEFENLLTALGKIPVPYAE